MLRDYFLLILGCLFISLILFNNYWPKNNLSLSKVLGVADSKVTNSPLGKLVQTIINKQRVCIDENNFNILVDKNKGIDPDYEPEDLLSLQKFGIKTINGDKKLRAEAAYQLRNMQTAFTKEFNSDFYISSAYRSYQHQQQVKQNWFAKIGIAAEKISASPGHSEHQLGTTIDISFAGNGEVKTDNPQWLWLRQNAHRFGFILSYDNDDKAFTGYEFEPWHWRYVGEEAAGKIFETDKTPLLFYQPKGCYFVSSG